MSPNGNELLTQRGILEAAAIAQWTPDEQRKRWIFPLYRADGKPFVLPDGRPAQRWKAFDSTSQYRYGWGYSDQGKDDVKKPDTCAYYWLPGGDVIERIAEANGLLYITAGEPDMLTLASIGYRNVTSFFGEAQVPDDLLTDLRRLGVRRVVYVPDLDNAGLDAAQKLNDALCNSEIQFTARLLPTSSGGDPINDLNDYWRANNFDAEIFRANLDVCRPMRFLAPRETDRGAAVSSHDDDMPAAYYDAIARALGAEKYKSGGWSLPIKCPFGSHEHDDHNPHAHWHKDKHILRCFKCGETRLSKEVAAAVGVEWRDYVERPTQRAERRVTEQLDGTPQRAIGLSGIVKSSDDSLARYKERLDGKGVQGARPLLFPLRALWKFEGMCRVVRPRKTICVLGLSGGGKTSFMETLGDIWRQSGENHMLWWGPEWSWEEMADRSIQRYGGLTTTQMDLHEMWLAEAAANIPEGERNGVKATDEQIELSKKVADDVAAWPGKTFYLDKMELSLDELLAVARDTIEEQKARGCPIRVSVWDYVQLARVTGIRDEGAAIRAAAARIKAFTADNELITIVATQPRKGDSSDLKEDQKMLESEAAQYLEPNTFNLFLSLNPHYANGNMQSTGTIKVTKNSKGRTGDALVHLDFAHLRWLDTKESK